MSEESGLICAYAFEGEHNIRELGWEEIRERKPGQGWTWIHLDWKEEESQRWIEEESGLDKLVCEALLADRTRPRGVVVGEGLMTTLHGVNLNFDAAPEDMISIRVWADANRVITLRSPHSRALQDVRDSILVGKGPEGPGEFLVRFAAALIERMDPVLEGLEKEAEGLEAEMAEGEIPKIRSSLRRLRRKAVLLRRHITPQLDVISRLEEEKIPWIGDEHRPRLREITDRLIRYLEDLDALLERGAALQDELANRLAEQTNRSSRILLLTMVMFLPLIFATVLLGMAMSYISGLESHSILAITGGALVVVAGLSAWIARRLGLF